MDWTNLALTLAKGWLRLTASVAIGITLGALLEISGWLEKLSRALSPPYQRE